MNKHSRYGQLQQGPRLRRAACQYAQADWPVFPLQPRGKRPLTKHGFKDASRLPSTIEGWWRKWPSANIGIAIPRGLIVVDIDREDALQLLRGQDLVLPSTASATTGRGRHLWYSIGDLVASNCANLFPGIDIRTLGGYVVAPPSVHPSGRLYEWQVPLEPSTISEAPNWLINKLADPVKAAPAGNFGRRRHSLLDKVGEGQRNHALARTAGYLFHWLPADDAAVMAQIWAESRLVPPLPHGEVLRTIDSIAKREARKRSRELW